MVSFVKMVMNPYPTLHDLSIVVFLIFMNVTLVTRYVEGFLFLAFGVFYGVINTGLMLVTWLHRFSGNANYLFFQVVVLDAFLVILFIQIFMAVDQKRKKYGQELLREQDKKQKPSPEEETEETPVEDGIGKEILDDASISE